MGTRYKVRPGRPASGSARACVPVSVSVQRRDLSISPLARGFIVATRLSFWILRKWFVIRFPISRSRSTLLYYPLTPARSPTPCIPASTVRLPPRPAPPRAAARGVCAPSSTSSGLRFGGRLYLGYSLLCVCQNHIPRCMLLQCRQHGQAVFNRSCNPIFTRSLREAARARACARRTRRRRAGEPASNPQVHEAPPRPPSGVSTARIQTCPMLRRCCGDAGETSARCQHGSRGRRSLASPRAVSTQGRRDG